MVHIVIHPLLDSEQKQQLVCLDFQGSLEAADGSDLSNLEVGTLTLQESSALLIIGHHKLVGKKQKLPKPFAVIHKRKPAPDDMDDSVCYDVVTILEEKYVFSVRPGLIVQESLRGLERIGK